MKYKVKNSAPADAVEFYISEIDGDIVLFAEVNGVNDAVLKIEGGVIYTYDIVEPELLEAFGLNEEGPLSVEEI